MQWTEKQQDVINTRHRNILVSAAAGSGKTAVLVERIIRMITDEEAPVDIDELLVVTFTRAAASEMKERIRDALESIVDKNNDENVRRQLSFIHNAHISTIDSFCARVVRENFEKIDLDPNFRIADETEIEMLKSDIIGDMIEEYYQQASLDFMELAARYSAGKVSDNLEELINTLYNYASGHIDPYQWVKDCIKGYDYNSIQEFEESSIMQNFLCMIKNRIDGLIDKLRLAYVISESDDGPHYGASLNKFIDMLTEVKKAESYSEVRAGLFDIGTVRLSGVKDCDENKKNQVSAMKKKVADEVKKIRDDYFDQTLDGVYEDVLNSKKSVETIIHLTLDFMERFQKEKCEKGIMDFNDQAHYAMKILNDLDEDGHLVPSDTAILLSKKYKEILIDEYQDSNFVQEAILSAITGGQGCNNMFMVGDVKQSIYRFRQAQPKLFLDKYNRYCDDLRKENCRIILDRNFRSRYEVINSVNYIFNYIMHTGVGGIDYQKGNQLVLGADYGPVPDNQDNDTEVIIIEGDEKKTEAEYVAQKIREITDPIYGMKITEKGKERTVRYGDIAILLRSMKGNSDIYLEQLENNKVPAFAESKTGYYQAMEVRTVIDALSIIDNPRQDIPLASVMLSPMFDFTSNELAIIKSFNDVEGLYDNVELYRINGDNKQLVKKVDYFLTVLTDLRSMVPYTSVYEMINKLLEMTGYDYYISAMVNGKKRKMNIEALKEKAVAYDAISYKGLFNFVRYIEKLQYLAKDDGEASAVSENDNIVHIMSIHKSKGLQFPIVFVCNTAGTFKNDIDSIVADENGIIGVDCINTDLKYKEPTIIKKTVKMENQMEDMAETLRILYVAMTRAQEKLFITGRTKNLEKTLSEFASYIYDSSDKMSYNDIVNSTSLMDWIGKTVGKNKAFQKVLENSFVETVETNRMYALDTCIKVKVVKQEDIVFCQLREQITDEIRKEVLKDLSNIKPDEGPVKDTLDKQFSFMYPYIDDITRHSKASVTEIKKSHISYEEELDGWQMEYGELKEIVPDFIKNEEDLKEGLKGAKRGTAYHRVFELLNMDLEEYSYENIQKMIEDFVDKGLLEPDQAEAVDVKDVLKFTRSKLFGRMKAAYKKGCLFREQKFLLRLPVQSIEPDSISKETMIVQGIIDVCFLEDNKYVIADYKTDKVSSMKELDKLYRIQLECYKMAVNQIAGKDKQDIVKDMVIYSVTLGDELSL